MDGDSGTPGSTTAGGGHIAPVVLKTLITVVVGTVAYVVTNLIDQSQDELWKLAMSIVIGGSALIVQYMVDFERRLEKVETGQDAQTRQLHDHYTRLSDAAGLLSELDQAGMSTHDVKRLIRSATQVAASRGPDILKDFARAEIKSLASVVTDLTGMTVHWQRDNNEWLLRLTECARSTIDATSSSADRPFWDTDPAGPYLKAQIKAMGDHAVTIRRLFMIKDTEEDDSEFMERFRELCQGQRDLGIQVRFMVLAQPRRSSLATRDIVIFDRALYLEYTTDRQDSHVQTRLDASADRVQDEAESFGLLWDAAAEPSPRPDPTPPLRGPR